MTTAMLNQLRQAFGDKLKVDVDMRQYTSLKIGGIVRAMVFPEHIADVKTLSALVSEHNVILRAIGGGTNLLVPDRGFDGVVLNTTKMVSHQFNVSESGDTVLSSLAGVRAQRLLSESVERGLRGLECTAGIPGTFGGVLWMNGGTHAGSIEDVLVSMDVLYPEGEVKTLKRADIPFRYRSCGLPRSVVILGGSVELVPEDKEKLSAEVERVKAMRKNQPLTYPNAGSIFKNPDGGFAGRLIESSGLKGFAIGGAQVSESHANFIINAGGATCNDALRLIQHIKDTVRQKHGVELECEVEVLE